MIAPAWKRFFFIAGGALFAVGLVGWYDRLVYGHLHANYGSVVPWGLWVALYVYCMGLSTGSFFISSLSYVFNLKTFARIGRLAVFTALVLVLMGLLFVWADAGHMPRAWHLFVYPNFHSPMAWATWFYTAYFALLVAELWVLLRHDLVREGNAPGLKGALGRLLVFGSRDLSEAAILRDQRATRVLATIGIPLALGAGVGAGVILGVVAARPHWHSGMSPIHFLLAALASGSALCTAFAAFLQEGRRYDKDAVLALGKLVLALLLLDVLFQISEALVTFYGGVPGHVQSLTLVLAGPYWWVFWAWQLGLGTLIPAVLLMAPARKDPRWVGLAGLLVAAGYLGLRLNMVIPGLAVEEILGLSAAIASPRITTHYVPSATEWLLIAWVIGLGLLLFGLVELLLPKEKEEGGHVRV